MPDFTPEAATPNPSDATLQLMAEALGMMPAGADMPIEWRPILRRQFIAAHQAAAASAPPAPAVDVWKLDYGVDRFVRADQSEFLSIRIAGKPHDIPRTHAIYLHGLMAHVLSPPRSSTGSHA